jgi:predicted permease
VPVPLFRWFSRKPGVDDRSEEMQAHMDLYAEDLRARGRSSEEARRDARLTFGNPRVKLEDLDALKGSRVVDGLWRELRFATRSLRRSPSFTAAVLAVLALALGASVVIFTIVDTTLLRGLPYDRADRLVAVGHLNSAAVHSNLISTAHYLALKERRDIFDGVALMTDFDAALKRDDVNEPQVIRGQRVTAGFFQVLRIVPAEGRFFMADDEAEGRLPVAVISDGLWRRAFGASAAVIGRRMATEQGDFEIVGVAPAGFSYPPGVVEPADVWVPYVIPAGGHVARYDRSVARLKDGVSIDQALARLNDQGSGVAVERGTGVWSLQEQIAGSARPWLLMLMAAAVCVLFIACVNIANLVLVRATVRTHELRIRAALGATRWDLARALLTESLLLALAGASLGLLLAWWGIDALRTSLPPALPRPDTIGIDIRVLSTAGACAIAIGVALSLVPMLRDVRTRDRSLRVEQTRSNTISRPTQWLRSLFVVSEIALAVVLLVGAALFLTSYSRVVNVDLGFDYRNVLLVRIQPPARPAGAGPDAAANRDALLRLIEHVGAIPGVDAAAVVSGTLPLGGRTTSAPFGIPGRELPRSQSGVTLHRVSAGYFTAMRIPIRTGREFTSTDLAGSQPVAILSDAAAAMYFGSDNPIGQMVELHGRRTVVGVAGNVRSAGPEIDNRPEIYYPASQGSAGEGTLVVRTSRSDDALLSQIRTLIRSGFPDLAIPPASTLEQRFATYIAVRRFNMLLLTLFGALGVAIAAAGIYGVMAYVVSQRTREIGIRKALGALPSRILLAVLGRAALQIGAGLAIGLPVAWMLSGTIESFLFNVEARAVGLYVVAAIVLVVVAIAAAAFPARRAARVDPVIALRSE